MCQTKNVDDDIDDKDDKESEGTITGSSISERFNNVSSDLQEEPLLASQAPKRRKKERLKKIFSHFRITTLAVLIIMSMVSCCLRKSLYHVNVCPFSYYVYISVIMCVHFILYGVHLS